MTMKARRSSLGSDPKGDKVHPSVHSFAGSPPHWTTLASNQASQASQAFNQASQASNLAFQAQNQASRLKSGLFCLRSALPGLTPALLVLTPALPRLKSTLKRIKSDLSDLKTACQATDKTSWTLNQHPQPSNHRRVGEWTNK